MTYQIGDLHNLNAESDPTFDTLMAALDAAETRADTLSTAVWGVWEDDDSGYPELVAIAHSGDVFWLDGYTVRTEVTR